MNEITDRTDSSQEGLFSKRALLFAFFGFLIFLVWAFVSLNLPWSSFRKAFLKQDDVSDFVVNINTTFTMVGALTGFVGFHLWKSEQRTKILHWSVRAGAVGALIGILVGAFVEVPPLYLALWPHTTFGNGRMLFFMQMVARFLVIPTSVAVLLSSTRRRAILKGVFFPLALSGTVRILLLSFVPVKTGFFHPPWDVVKLVISEAGYDTGYLITAALVVAVIRKIKGSSTQNSDQ